MKIIFGNENQKETLLQCLGLSDICPGELGVKEIDINQCSFATKGFANCRDCWEYSGIDMEVK